MKKYYIIEHRLAVIFLLCSCLCIWADATVKDVSVKSRWPWNGLVDITYSIQCDEIDEEGKPKDVYLVCTGIDNVRNKKYVMKTLMGDGVSSPVKDGGPYTMTWDALKDAPAFNTSSFQVKIYAMIDSVHYLVVDLSGGPNANSYPMRFTANPPDLSNDICRTSELWLRWIPAGKFLMGSPEEEEGRRGSEELHEVTITKRYYLGVFECTQRQWELVMGTKPSYFYNTNFYATRPVEKISYEMIRGTGAQAGAGWPTYGHTVDSISFMGKLQEKTGLAFDLPTDAQWEYVCRAGTVTALNSGKNLMPSLPNNDANMNEVGRYWNNGGSSGLNNPNCSMTYGTAKVGSYLPNNWGVYDMHGNVWEWVLDWWIKMDVNPKVDPKGGSTGTERVLRGGGWAAIPRDSRAARRGGGKPSDIYDSNGKPALGFRIAWHP